MVVFLIALTEDERRVVKAERESHPEAHVRREMLVVWLRPDDARREAGVADDAQLPGVR